ncbi:hypothetical protein [Priestia megaterium]|uniref:hypothetical protein n=1 Tax=Priestia megaterium TaxID=1404 RepID=UPI000CA11148|nr:hypothetical protein [Priestia megaterium]PVE64675.1 hypothetical protein DC428_22995 [Priestia megaterium]PVE80222.1 hypothetical protein DC426_26345 [Priestia megaterium]PVE88485.1 hypothetical protein DC421_00035 [Priestia megaterium]PVE93182.1 hypothetical protein DC433_26150 [Priestia megaterium]RMA90124.1 hypothetical protein DEU44_2193 [Priestia megaterium]
MKFNKPLSLISFVAVIIFSIIPHVGIKVVDEVFRSYYFGFPARWLGYHRNGQFSFQVFNLVFNFLIFYFLFWIINKFLKRILRVQS